jgi:hypothetical protein
MPTGDVRMTKHAIRSVALTAIFAASLSGCAVVAVTDAAVTVAATAVKVGANVVGAGTDVARAGIRALTSNNDQKK